MVIQDTLNNDITFEVAQETIYEDIKNKYLAANWDSSCIIEYNTYSYKYSPNIELDIYTRIYQKKIISQVILHNETVLNKNFIVEKEETIDDKINEFIDFLYNIKFNYVYSKIVDNLLLKDTQNKEEKKTIAKLFIKHDIVDDCCVCLEKNTVLTKCKHNLCRICSYNLYKNSKSEHIPCPICRKCITNIHLSDEESINAYSDED